MFILKFSSCFGGEFLAVSVYVCVTSSIRCDRLRAGCWLALSLSVYLVPSLVHGDFVYGPDQPL